MAPRISMFSLGAVLLLARVARAAEAEDVPFMAYEESYGQPSQDEVPMTTLGGGYGYEASPPESTLPSITTPSTSPTASSSSSSICTNSTTTVTIPWSSSTPSSSSGTCSHTTITSTIYPSSSTPSASSACGCNKSTTTVTIPWPGTGSGYVPSGTGYAGTGGDNGTATYHTPTLGTNPPSTPASDFQLPETTAKVQSSSVDEYGGNTATPTPAPEPEPQPEPSGNVPPAPPASSTGPDEPLFTGGAARYSSGVSVAIAVGALVACL